MILFYLLQHTTYFSNETRIEIYTLEKNTLIPALDFDVYCQIAKLHIINSKVIVYTLIY